MDILCEGEGGIDGNCSRAAANTEGAARGEAGAAARGRGGGKGGEGEGTFAPGSMRTLVPGVGGWGGGALLPLYGKRGTF